jgi:hypothetical protein
MARFIDSDQVRSLLMCVTTVYVFHGNRHRHQLVKNKWDQSTVLTIRNYSIMSKIQGDISAKNTVFAA